MSSFSPDLILHGGKIAVMDADGRFISALAVHAGRIIATGGDDDIRALAGAGTEMFNLEGRTAIPGIVDSHAHPDGYAARIASWEMVSPDKIAARQAFFHASRNWPRCGDRMNGLSAIASTT